MSKAPETIYLQCCGDDSCKCFDGETTWCVDEINSADQKYVRADLAHGYSMWRGANAQVERLRATLTQISRNASVMTAHQIETMARDALTKEG